MKTVVWKFRTIPRPDSYGGEFVLANDATTAEIEQAIGAKILAENRVAWYIELVSASPPKTAKEVRP